MILRFFMLTSIVHYRKIYLEKNLSLKNLLFIVIKKHWKGDLFLLVSARWLFLDIVCSIFKHPLFLFNAFVCSSIENDLSMVIHFIGVVPDHFVFMLYLKITSCHYFHYWIDFSRWLLILGFRYPIIKVFSFISYKRFFL